MDDWTSGGSRTLTALFDTSAEAERAVARLRAAGIPDSSIRVTQGSSYDASSYQDQHKGFWESLGDFFFPDEDRYAYAEGLSRGAQLVTVTGVSSDLYDTAVDILDEEGSVDLNAREAEWRQSGWSDYRSSSYYDEDEYARTHRSALGDAAAGVASAAGGAATAVGAAVDSALGGAGSRGTIHDDGHSDRQMAADTSGGRAAFGTERASYAGATADVSGDETVKVVEERIAVGKREAEAGRVRVRAYVREEPVEASVDLRSTRVFIERRPVDRAVTAGDVDFQDRVIEAREHVEVPVVAKEARVVEEIGLRQETEVRTETVADTVRKTEVEIEDERTGEVTRVSGSGTTTGGTSGGTSGRGY